MSDETPEHIPPQDTPRRRPWPRRLLRAASMALLSLFGIVAIVLLLLQTNWGAQMATRLILGFVDPFSDAVLRVEKTEGTFITRLDLTGVSIVQKDSIRGERHLVEIDSLRLRYSLRGLLSRRLSFSEFHAVNPRVRMHQLADGSWDLVNALPIPEEVDTSAAAFLVEMAELSMVNGRAAIHFYPAEHDSVMHVDDFNVFVRDLVLGDEVSLAVDSLWLALRPPGEAATVGFRTAGSLYDGRLLLDSLRVESERTDLVAHGSLQLPGSEGDYIRDIDFRVHARPLAFSDVRAFIPTLDPARELTLEARVTGTSALMHPRIDARTDDGASLFLEGDLATGIDGPVAYRFTGELRRFDPAIVTGGDRGAVLLSADLRTDLEGTSLQEIDGTLDARVFNSRFGEFAPDRTVLSARFRNGTATIDLRGGLRGTTLATSGTVRPFDETISYDLRGSFADLDFYRFTEDPGGVSNLGGDFRLRGRGVSPATATVDLGLALRRSVINDYVLESGTVDLRLAGGTGTGTARVILPEGLIAAAGEVDFGDEITYRISRGRVENLDVAALTGNEGPSSITGSFTANGRGTDPSTMALTSRVDLERSTYQELTFIHGTASIALDGGRLRFDAEADLEGGSFDFAGVIRPFESVQSYQITRGRFRNVDIGRLTGSEDQESNLSGTVVGSGRGFDPRTMIADFRLDLDASRLNQQDIDGAEIIVATRRGEVRLDGEVAFPEGRIQLVGRVRPFLDRPDYEIEQGYFSGVDIGAITNNPALSTRLRGSVRLSGEGFEPETMRLSALLNLDESRVNRAHIRDGRLQAELRNGFTHLSTRVDLLEGMLEVDARGRLFDQLPTYEAQGAFHNVDLSSILVADTVTSNLSGSFAVEGRGFDPETMRLEGFVAAEDSHYEDVEITEVRADFYLFDGLLHVDEARVRSNIAVADGRGQLALFDPTGRYESDFSFSASVSDLEPLAPIVGARVLDVESASVDARFYGPPGQVRFDAAGSMRSFVYDDLRIAGFRGEIAGALDPGMEIQLAEATGEMDYFSTGDFSLQSTNFAVTYAEETVDFAVESVVDGRRDLSAAGRVDVRPDHRQAVLERVSIRLDDDRWELLDEATILYGEEIRISNLLLFSGQQQIAIDGVINPEGEQNLIITIEDFRVDAVADLLGYRGLGGVMTGYIDLTGPAEAPRLSGLLDADITADGRPVGDMVLTLDYDNLRLNMEGVLTHDDGSRLGFDGYVPLDLRLVAQEAEGARPGVAIETGERPVVDNVNLEVVSENFAINWIMPFMDRDVVDGLDGRLDGRITIGGTLENPILDGDLTVSQGRMRLPQLDILVRDAQVNALLVDNRIEIQRAFARSGDGSLTASGSLNMQELTLGEWDLRVNMNRFLAINSNEYRFVVNGEMVLGGTTSEPVLSGNARVISGDIWLTDETTGTAETVPLTEQDLRMLEQRFGFRATEADTAAFDFYEALDLRLSLTLERNTWLRSRGTPNMDVQFTGNLDVSKAPNAELVVFGNIDVIPERSRVRQFGRSFDITSGTLQFNGPIEEALVDFDAEYRVRARSSTEDQVTIVLGITGRLDSLELELYSRDPPGLDMADIVSYIAVGRPASEGFMLGGGAPGGELRRLTTTAVLDQITGWVEGVAGEELGLDVIEIEQDGLRGTVITAGKYLTRRLFVAVSQPITQGGDEAARADFRQEYRQRVVVEYEFTNWLLSRFTAEGENLRVMLLWEYSY
jgi:translocation and assembly module TamB